MKLLLDEHLPHDLRHSLTSHTVFTVTYMGWSGMANGKLLAETAANGFDALITMDTGLQYEQNAATLPCAVVVLKARSNRLDDLLPLVPALLAALPSLQPKSLVRIGT